MSEEKWKQRMKRYSGDPQLSKRKHNERIYAHEMRSKIPRLEEGYVVEQNGEC